MLGFTGSGYGSIYVQASVNSDDGYLIRCGKTIVTTLEKREIKINLQG